MESRLPPGNLVDWLNALPLGAFAGDWLPDPEPPPPGGGGLFGEPAIAGEAYGLFADLNVIGLLQLNVPPTPAVTLPEEGGALSEEVLSLAVDEALTVDALYVATAGEQAGAGQDQAAYAASVSYLANVVLNLLVDIQLTAVSAAASCYADMTSGADGGPVALCSDEGSQLLGTVGTITIDVTPEPNTELLDLLGIRVVLNEQVREGDGVCSAGLTVNMVHIYGDGTLIEGEVVIGHAKSSVNLCGP